MLKEKSKSLNNHFTGTIIVPHLLVTIILCHGVAPHCSDTTELLRHALQFDIVNRYDR